MYARLGAQPTESMVTLKTNRCRLDSSYLTGGCLDQFGLEALTLTPTKKHPEEHLRPVLCLGATGASLYINEGGSRILFTGEHSPEFESGNALFESGKVGGDRFDRLLVIFLARHLKKILGIPEPIVQSYKGIHGLLQGGSLLAELLSTLRIVPDRRVLEFSQDFFKFFTLGVIVKDTP